MLEYAEQNNYHNLKPAKSKRFHDDEALLHFLRIDRSADAWKSAYDYYRQPIYTYYQALNYSEEQIKPILIKAFAELLENIRSRDLHPPLPGALLEVLLSYCLLLEEKSENFEKPNVPSGYTYLAKKVLVDRLQQPNKEQITQAIYNSFKEPALKIIQSRYPLQESELEDVFQEAMLGLLGRPPQDTAGNEAKLFTYFMQILRYKTLDLLKEKGKGEIQAGDLEDFNLLLDHLANDPGHKNNDFWDYVNEIHNLGEKFSSNDEVVFLDKLLTKISSDCRKLLTLRFIEEKKFKEIAEIIDCSIDSVGQRVKRCVKNMRLGL
ncbi:MAG: hypothetical protein DHS20C18_48640 [Saprospiraceae bacterium]|nr:MAG: hypothetical protein DHS20C18_48640 [Saprospiraceae bacterium]